MGINSTFWNESAGHCDCCGCVSKKIWGDLSDAAGTQAVYFVHWTVGAPEHFPNIDLVLGQWGEGAEPINRDLVSPGSAEKVRTRRASRVCPMMH